MYTAGVTIETKIRKPTPIESHGFKLISKITVFVSYKKYPHVNEVTRRTNGGVDFSPSTIYTPASKVRGPVYYTTGIGLETRSTQQKIVDHVM